jgi:hypothetical protein
MRTVEELESADCGELLREMREADDAFHRAIPPLGVLARQYGHDAGDRLYALRDLEWKWVDRYLNEHPEMSRGCTFDDLATCVLRR